MDQFQKNESTERTKQKPVEQIPSRYCFRKETSGITILRVQAQGDTIIIPEQIRGIPVTALAPYACSAEIDTEPEGDWEEAANELGLAGTRPLCGNAVKTVLLPPTLRHLGRYAFYNCKKLQTLVLSSTLHDIGTGAFAGCDSLSELEITVDESVRSCLKEILAELNQAVLVRGTQGGEAFRLVFPPFYEEIMENTPARIFMTAMHGCGNRYRYCFLDTMLQMREYDELFHYAKEQEALSIVLELAISRLMVPWHLQERHKTNYKEWLLQHPGDALRYLKERKETERIRYLAETLAETPDQLDELLCACGSDAALRSMLMEIKRTRFSIKKKTFEW